MNVYVAYEEFDYEGCSGPLAAFSSLGAARRFFDEQYPGARMSKWSKMAGNETVRLSPRERGYYQAVKRFKVES